METKKGRPLFRNKEINNFLNKNIENCLSLDNGEFQKVLFNDNFFVILQNCKLKHTKDCIFESHKEYFDIHYIIKGKEKMELLKITDLKAPYESNIENDYYLFNTSKLGKNVTLSDNEFIIFPFDLVHKVGIAESLNNSVFKIVIKIKKSLFDKEFINE